MKKSIAASLALICLACAPKASLDTNRRSGDAPEYASEERETKPEPQLIEEFWRAT